jgi:hypothetical protein
MALEGTLKDFALPDILQLIGIQRKTGVLTMENGQDKVTVQFHQGNVVGADNSSRQIEECLGTVLVRTGRISEVQLKEALAIQKETLQRLGYILVKSGYLTEGELREALRIQISQIVYRLFRWRDGRYHFLALDHLEYDRNLTIPVSAESLLMEAARMVDEWPILERRIKSPTLVFRKTALGLEFERSMAAAVADDVEFALDLLDGPVPQSHKEPEVTPEEREVLAGLDGAATVQHVVDRSAYGEFDVYRVLHDLLQRGLVEEVQVAAPKAQSVAAEGVSAWRTWAGLAVLAALSVLSVATAKVNPAAPWRVGALGREQDDLRAYVSRARIERVEQAVQCWFVRTASLPAALPHLVEAGYLKGEDVRDPWGRPYGYESDEAGFRLTGWDAEGGLDPALELSHPLSPSQRMLLEGPPENAAHP